MQFAGRFCSNLQLGAAEREGKMARFAGPAGAMPVFVALVSDLFLAFLPFGT